LQYTTKYGMWSKLFFFLLKSNLAYQELVFNDLSWYLNLRQVIFLEYIKNSCQHFCWTGWSIAEITFVILQILWICCQLGYYENSALTWWRVHIFHQNESWNVSFYSIVHELLFSTFFQILFNSFVSTLNFAMKSLFQE